MSIAGRSRSRHRLGRQLGGSFVPPVEVDANVHVIGGWSRRAKCLSIGPRWLAAFKHGPAGSGTSGGRPCGERYRNNCGARSKACDGQIARNCEHVNPFGTEGGTRTGANQIQARNAVVDNKQIQKRDSARGSARFFDSPGTTARRFSPVVQLIRVLDSPVRGCGPWQSTSTDIPLHASPAQRPSPPPERSATESATHRDLTLCRESERPPIRFEVRAEDALPRIRAESAVAYSCIQWRNVFVPPRPRM